MQIELGKYSVTLTRQPGDKALGSERAVTHAMRVLLRAKGIDSRRMRGYLGLTSCPTASVLRLPKSKDVAESVIWHDSYAIVQSHVAFNRGSVTFTRVW